MSSTGDHGFRSLWRTDETLSRRRAALIARLAERQLGGCLLTSDHARGYFSGFTAESHHTVPTAVLLVGHDRTALLTSANNVAWAESEAPGVEVVVWRRPWWPMLGELLNGLGWTTLGFQADHLSVAAYGALVDSCPATIIFEDLGDIAVELRAVKDESEILTLQHAAEITDRAFVEATANLTAGLTERELALRLDRAMQDHGAGPGFPTIVASGPNAARPHHAPTARPIRPGEPVIIDMGARFDGYTADLTRTVWIGDPEPMLATIYPVVARANEASQAATRAGISGRNLDSVARKVIAAAGYGDAFVHGLGHGVGLEIHEAPSAGQQSDDTLVASNTLTIEPGIYIPGWGGVRIEDMGVVTNDGFRRLSNAPK